MALIGAAGWMAMLMPPTALRGWADAGWESTRAMQLIEPGAPVLAARSLDAVFRHLCACAEGSVEDAPKAEHHPNTFNWNRPWR